MPIPIDKFVFSMTVRSHLRYHSEGGPQSEEDAKSRAEAFEPRLRDFLEKAGESYGAEARVRTLSARAGTLTSAHLADLLFDRPEDWERAKEMFARLGDDFEDIVAMEWRIQEGIKLASARVNISRPPAHSVGTHPREIAPAPSGPIEPPATPPLSLESFKDHRRRQFGSYAFVGAVCAALGFIAALALSRVDMLQKDLDYYRGEVAKQQAAPAPAPVAPLLPSITCAPRLTCPSPPP